MERKRRLNRANPKNPSSSLFKRLTRLFSGPLNQYQTKRPVQLKRRHYNKFDFQTASAQKFKKNAYNPFSIIQARTLSEVGRMERYTDAEQMEFEPVIAAALDTYGDEMTTHTKLSKLLHIECQDQKMKAVLTELYYKILDVETNLYWWCRSMCKFGDFFLYLEIEEGKGVSNALGLPVQEIERLEGEDERNPNYVMFNWNTADIQFENWQIAHFRILGNDKYYPYGTSVLDSSRRAWRQLNLMEDAMMAYRIVRSSERRVFYVQVAGIHPDDVEQHIERMATSFKRHSVADPDTGRVDLRYNPMSIEEDFFVPVRGDVGSRIETLPGGTFSGDIEDVKHIQEKLFAALRIPQSYLARGEGSDEDKQTLSQKDTRFAKIVQRLQLAPLTELKKIGIIHLASLGYSGNSLLEFELGLNNPSKLAELQELEDLKVRLETAAGAVESGFYSKRAISEKILGMNQKEFERNQIELFYDRKMEARIDAMEGMTEAGTGGEFGGELGELDSTEDMEAAEGGEEEEPTVGGEDSSLLAAPGKRDDDYSKGYKPRHGGHMDMRKSGARRRHRLNGLSNYESASSTSGRNVWKGLNLQEIQDMRERDLQLLEEKYAHLDEVSVDDSSDLEVINEEKIIDIDKYLRKSGEDSLAKYELEQLANIDLKDSSKLYNGPKLKEVAHALYKSKVRRNKK